MNLLTDSDKEKLKDWFSITIGALVFPYFIIVYVCLLPFLAIAAFCLCFYRVMEGIK